VIEVTDWEELGGVAAARLAEARLQIHWAAQAAAAAGKLMLPHQPDFSEQSFQWSQEARALAQGAIGPAAARPAFRAAVRPSPPALLLLGGDWRPLRELPLGGRTLEEAFGWLERELAGHLGRPLPAALERPGELPPHPYGIAGSGRMGTGAAPFDDGDAEAFAELARLFANADRLLRGWRREEPRASAVRCWPHHFDLAALVQLEGNSGAKGGMESMGDMQAVETMEEMGAMRAMEMEEMGAMRAMEMEEMEEMEVSEIPGAREANGVPGAHGSESAQEAAAQGAESAQEGAEAADTAPSAAAEQARTIGVGMVPGDAARPFPYLYVTPWPYPPHPELPPLPAGGQWNTEGWLGAVLEGPCFMTPGDPAAQVARATEFLRAAAAACRRLMESP
jgi:hypothetical protein